MIQGTKGTGIGAALEALSDNGRRPVATPANTSFEGKLEQAIGESLAKLGLDPGQVKVHVTGGPAPETSQKNDSAGTARQIFVTIQQPPRELVRSEMTAQVIPLPKEKQVFSYSELENPTADPTERVKEELRARGVDPSSMRFERYDQVVNNIGGNYTNYLLRVWMPNGEVGEFDVPLANRNPEITAVEIMRLMNWNPANGLGGAYVG
jgi:hypothetical protein